MPLELFILPHGLYPRRVLIYLYEKGLLRDSSSNLVLTPVTQSGLQNVAPGKPPGSVPILALGNGKFIRQSLSIISYFEDICDFVASGNTQNLTEEERAIGILEKEKGSMRGETAVERARMREILVLADEATTHFGTACHKGSAMFALLEAQSATASKFAMQACRKTLGLIGRYMEEDSHYEKLGKGEEEGATLADCVLFALLQFAKEFYSVDLAVGLERVDEFYVAFAKRESTRLDEGAYDPELKKLAGHFMKESDGTFGVVWERMKVVGVYLGVLFSTMVVVLVAWWRKLY